jgi:alpha-beta hydrolase superfamily lysophospholipase
MSRREEKFVAGGDTALHVYAWDEVAGAPKGAVAIAHGMAEHAARYDEFARYLNARGYVVEAHDHRGHGLTAPSPSPEALGHFADDNGWALVVSDVVERLEDMRRRHPGLPLTLFSHSMGSFMAQQCLYQAPDLLDAVILSGSSGKPPRIAGLGRLIARLERLRLGKRGRSALLETMSFGRFNRRFAPNRTNFDWLSRDPAAVDAYIADPLCGFRCTNQLWIDLLDALPRIARPFNRRRIPEPMPVMILSGDADPVGIELSELIGGYRGACLQHLAVRLYPGGRHEMLNETNKAEVFADVAAWLDANASARS